MGCDDLQEKKLAEMPKASEGYGGKFGVQKDRMDKVGYLGDLWISHC